MNAWLDLAAGILVPLVLMVSCYWLGKRRGRRENPRRRYEGCMTQRLKEAHAEQRRLEGEINGMESAHSAALDANRLLFREREDAEHLMRLCRRQRDQALRDRDALQAQSDELRAERDVARLERDGLLAQLDDYAAPLPPPPPPEPSHVVWPR